MASVVFPLDIINEILSRLPVKFLLQFRCVSKPWCSLIDSKEFVKQHLNQSVVTKSNLNIILGVENIFSFSIDSVPSGVVPVERLAPPPFSNSIRLNSSYGFFLINNSCNGLSLLQLKKPEPEVSQLCIWNPFTRKYMELPYTPIEYPGGNRILNLLIAKEWYAFAYVSEIDDYKVVRVVEFTRLLDTVWIGSESKIFSSTSNEWKRIEDFPYQLGFKKGWGAHLNGILHTVVKIDSEPWSIMGFDVRSEQHVMVPKPELGAREGVGIVVDVLGGCLCLIKQHFCDLISDVWIMKDYGVKDSWVKLFSITRKSFSFGLYTLGYMGFLQPLCYSKNGEEVILNEINERLYWYNLKTGIVREITFNMDFEFFVEVCFESLVSIPGFISVDSVKEEGKNQGDLKKVSKEKRFTKKRGISLKKGLKLNL